MSFNNHIDFFFEVTENGLEAIFYEIIPIWATIMRLPPDQVRNDVLKVYQALKNWWFNGRVNSIFSKVNSDLQYTIFRDFPTLMEHFIGDHMPVEEVWSILMKAFYL